MKYDGVSDVVYGATYDTKRPYLSKSFLDWILAGASVFANTQVSDLAEELYAI
jgi:hypothetical protein